MSRIFMTSLAALLPLGLAWAASADAPAADGTSASCDIRVVRDGGTLVLEGLAFSGVPAAGTYEFRISQGGPAGGSNIQQGGDFEVGPGAGTSLGLISLSDQGGYTATLTVHWHDGAPACTRHVGIERNL